MFGKQFYPTPIELGRTAIAPLLDDLAYVQDLTVLDPCAGRGDFIEAYLSLIADQVRGEDERITEEMQRLLDQGKSPSFMSTYGEEKTVEACRKKCAVIEIDEDLQNVLMGRGYDLVGTDFRNFKSYLTYDLVLMNPPFANGAEFALRLWQHVNFKKAVCILNAETLRNPTTKEREMLCRIIEENNMQVLYQQSAFSQADRRTDVEVVLVYMEKKQAKNIFDPIDTERMKPLGELADEIQDINALAKPDIVGNLVKSYDAAVEEYVEFRRAARKMEQRENQFYWYQPDGTNLKGSDSASRIENAKGRTDQDGMEDYLKRLNRAAWCTLFKLTNTEGKITEKVKEQFQDNQAKVGTMAFTEENIYTVLGALAQNLGQMMGDCTEEVFDMMTKYYEDNRVYFEGWKTNDAYEVGERVVLQNKIKQSWADHTPDIDWQQAKHITDIDKVMCFCSGVRYSEMEQEGIVETIKKDGEWGALLDSYFFEIRVYKKGTMHLRFKDEDVRRRFNEIVCRKRNWLKAFKQKYKHGSGGKVKAGDLVLFED